MKIYLINLQEELQETILKDVNEEGVKSECFDRVTNLIGFSSILGDALLLVGLVGLDGYIDELLSTYTRIRKATNNPIIFIVGENDFSDDLLSKLSSIGSNVSVIGDTSYNSALIKKEISAYKNFSVKKPPLVFNEVLLDVQRFRCTYDGKEVLLTKTEMSILHFMMASDGENITHDELMMIFKVQAKKISANTLASHIRNIKNKIFSETGKKDFIKSRYGFGYRL